MSHMARNGHAAAAGSPRGAFILFEGVDRCGKTTQSRRLVDHLTGKGVAAELWRFPDRYTPIGRMIDTYLTGKSETNDAAVHLLFSANRWEKRDEMVSALLQGRTLVVDRYAYSGAAFTAAKRVPGLDLEWCKAPDRGLPAPDVVIQLHLSPTEAALRGGYGAERYEKEDLQKEVARQFALMTDDTWRTLDASGTVEQLEVQVQDIAQDAIGRCLQGTPLHTLWSRPSGAVLPVQPLQESHRDGAPNK